MEHMLQEEAEISFWAFVLGVASVVLFFFSIFLDAQPARSVRFASAAMAFADGAFSFLRYVKFRGRNAIFLAFSWFGNGIVLIALALGLLG